MRESRHVFSEVVHDPNVKVVRADHCRFSRTWKKRTRFLVGNIDDDDLKRLSNMCCGTQGYCLHTESGRRFLLQGSSPNGKLWTSLAAVCPPAMAGAIAHAVTAKDFGELINGSRCL